MGRGRGRGKRTQRRHFGRGNADRGDQWTERRPQAGGEVANDLTSPAFEDFYKEQKICPPEEWDDFLGALRRTLPITFRINGHGKFADDLRAKLETDFMSHFTQGEEVMVAGEPVDPPHPLPWYPDGLAWQMNFSRTQLRREPMLASLHEFIKRENELGAITRQEAVSMVPPLFMDVKPHHRVLDMCAAPGSKTFQLLEALHSGTDTQPSGLVIANDADSQRCNLLIHQVQRMRSPALVVTNHEAQLFPKLNDLDPNSTDTTVMFDRILCDVPCCGDGTLRKQPDIWRRWGTGQGNGLHNLQLRITLRACELLKVGGRMVYSTCTFNPIEDEAVVKEVLQRTGGAMELVDVSNELPQLKRCAGLKTWRVKDRDTWYDNWEEGSVSKKLDPTMFPDEACKTLPLERCMRFLPHHQDTGGFFVAVLQKVSEMGPVDMPTQDHREKRSKWHKEKKGDQKRRREDGTVEEGGVAAEGAAAGETEPEQIEIEAPDAAVDTAKEAEPAAEEAEPAPAPKVVEKVMPVWGIRGGGGRGRAGGKWKGVDPIVPYVDAEEIKIMKEYYGLSPECDVTDNLIARSEETYPKKLSLVSSSIKTLLRMDTHEKMKVIFAGLKIMERQDIRGGALNCRYRLTQESLPIMMPYMSKQQFKLGVKEFLAVLADRSVDLPEEFKLNIVKPPREGEAPAAEGAPAEEGAPEAAAEPKDMQVHDIHAKKQQMISDPISLEGIKNLTYGCCVATLRDEDVAALGLAGTSSSETALAANAPLAMVCWRGNSVINVMVSRPECNHMADKLRAAVAKTGFKLEQGDAPAGEEPAAQQQ